MSGQIRAGGQLCACGEPSHKRQGNRHLCAMHYRIANMRARAKRDGKVVPATSRVEALASDMACSGCRRVMHWLREDGASLQATLQHDRDGTIRVLCLGCNTRHAQHPGDSFYSLKPEEKFCAKCCRFLPAHDFTRDRSRPIGLKSSCRACSAKLHKEWRSHRACA
jgi:RNase P subunit RPR2